VTSWLGTSATGIGLEFVGGTHSTARNGATDAPSGGSDAISEEIINALGR
jgi:hypothetical protein